MPGNSPANRGGAPPRSGRRSASACPAWTGTPAPARRAAGVPGEGRAPGRNADRGHDRLELARPEVLPEHLLDPGDHLRSPRPADRRAQNTRNWLSSDAGKNSLPMSGTSPRLARNTASTPTTTTLRWPSAHWSTSWYPASSRSKNAWLSRMKRSRRRRLAGSGAHGTQQPEAQSGVTVRDTRNDANSENEIVKVRGMKRSFDCPSRKIVGEDHDRRDRGDEDRHRDFPGGVQHGGVPVLAGHGEVAVDAELDDRVVHQAADGQGEPAEREDVQRLAEEVHRDQRAQDRAGSPRR